MKNLSFLLIAALIFLTTTLNSQGVPKYNQKLVGKNIYPILVFSDIKTCKEILQTIELKATEVDAFLEFNALLSQVIEHSEGQNLKPDDPIKVEMDYALAENGLFFLSRGKLTGAEALAYKRFTTSIRDAIKLADGEAKPKPKTPKE